MAVPDGASCYIGLDERSDKAGKPLVRDCSCRGNTAGFAHLSCIIEYAEQKSKQAADSDLDGFFTPWDKCNNCNQDFQNQVSLDLSSAFVSFAEKAYNFPGNSNWDKVKVITALRSKIGVLLREDKGIFSTECEILLKKLLSMVDQTKKYLKMSRWLHMPPTNFEYQYYQCLCGDYEAFGYKYLGLVMSFDKTEASYKISITYYQKTKAIFNLLGLEDDAKFMDITIAELKDCLARCDGDGVNVALSARLLLKDARYKYEYYLKMCGLTSEATLLSAITYVTFLVKAHRGIKAEGLIVKLAAHSRRVHGPEHNCSISLDKKVKECKLCYVSVMPNKEQLQALRYKNDGEMCVVTGPMLRLTPGGRGDDHGGVEPPHDLHPEVLQGCRRGTPPVVRPPDHAPCRDHARSHRGTEHGRGHCHPPPLHFGGAGEI